MSGRKNVPYAERKFDAKKKQAYDNKYMAENYDRVAILLPKGYKDRIKEYANTKGLSMTELFKQLIDEELPQ